MCDGWWSLLWTDELTCTKENAFMTMEFYLQLIFTLSWTHLQHWSCKPKENWHMCHLTNISNCSIQMLYNLTKTYLIQTDDKHLLKHRMMMWNHPQQGTGTNATHKLWHMLMRVRKHEYLQPTTATKTAFTAPHCPHKFRHRTPTSCLYSTYWLQRDKKSSKICTELTRMKVLLTSQLNRG